MNMLLFLSKIFYGQLPSKYAVKVAWSFVDFVLPKLFPHIDIVSELLRDGKWTLVYDFGIPTSKITGFNQPKRQRSTDIRQKYCSMRDHPINIIAYNWILTTNFTFLSSQQFYHIFDILLVALHLDIHTEG